MEHVTQYSVETVQYRVRAMTSLYRISIHIPHETSIVARQCKLDQQSSDSRLWVVVVVVAVVVAVVVTQICKSC